MAGGWCTIDLVVVLYAHSFATSFAWASAVAGNQHPHLSARVETNVPTGNQTHNTGSSCSNRTLPMHMVVMFLCSSFCFIYVFLKFILCIFCRKSLWHSCDLCNKYIVYRSLTVQFWLHCVVGLSSVDGNTLASYWLQLKQLELEMLQEQSILTIKQ